MSTIVYNDQGRPLLWVPDAFKGAATKLLKFVNAATTSDSELRRKICSREPLIFALVYLPHKLRSEETSMKYSLNPLHIYMAEDAATYWPFPLRPKEVRRAIVAPRDSGKTTWEFLILPCWAACYNWRMFCAFFGDSAERAEEHLANLRFELDNNVKLQEDFPELCTPAKRNGRALGDSKQVYRSVGGHIFMARGIEARNLGLNERGRRPDLIVIDDCEPLGQYSMDSKKKRQNIIINGILPMNLNAAVYLVGTVVRYGSIMHEVVQSDTGGGRAQWITDEKFVTKYWPAFWIDPNTREAVSFWPEKWSMDFIRAEYRTYSFQLNWMNQPAIAGQGLWRDADLHYGLPFVIARRILSIDPATTSTEKSDETGVAVIGFDAGNTRAYVEYAKGVRLDPDRMRELIRLLLTRFPDIETVIIETNQGGDYVKRQLGGVVPPNVRVALKHESRPKPERIRELHDWSQRKWVFLSTEVHAFVDQALAYPDVKHDDVVDAVAKGCHHHLQHRELPRAG